MGINITLTGEPRSTNRVYLYHCRFGTPSGYMSADGRNLKDDYKWQIKSQYHNSPIENPLKLKVELFFGTRRVHDIDNFNKLLLDACTGLIWVDDRQIQEMTLRKNYDKKNPRIELEIDSLEPER